MKKIKPRPQPKAHVIDVTKFNVRTRPVSGGFVIQWRLPYSGTWEDDVGFHKGIGKKKFKTEKAAIEKAVYWYLPSRTVVYDPEGKLPLKGKQ